MLNVLEIETDEAFDHELREMCVILNHAPKKVIIDALCVYRYTLANSMVHAQAGLAPSGYVREYQRATDVAQRRDEAERRARMLRDAQSYAMTKLEWPNGKL
jgi:hypothetical protein